MELKKNLHKMQNTHTPLNSTHPILFQKIVRKIVLNPLIAVGRFISQTALDGVSVVLNKLARCLGTRAL